MAELVDWLHHESITRAATNTADSTMCENPYFGKVWQGEPKKMMAEYIKREDAEKALLQRCEETGYGGLTRDDVRLVMRTPWRIPTADVISKDDLLKLLAEIDGNFKLKEDNNG